MVGLPSSGIPTVLFSLGINSLGRSFQFYGTVNSPSRLFPHLRYAILSRGYTPLLPSRTCQLALLAELTWFLASRLCREQWASWLLFGKGTAFQYPLPVFRLFNISPNTFHSLFNTGEDILVCFTKISLRPLQFAFFPFKEILKISIVLLLVCKKMLYLFSIAV